MKHLWFGAGLLAFLLVVSIWLGSALEQIHHGPAMDLEKAAEAAMDENWDLAAALYIRARKHWDSHRNLSAALVNHGPLDQIEGSFERLNVYADRQETTSFCAACGQLAQQLRSLPQSHSFSWWNLL